MLHAAGQCVEYLKKCDILLEDAGDSYRDAAHIVSALVAICVDPNIRTQRGLLQVLLREFIYEGCLVPTSFWSSFYLFLQCVRELMLLSPTQFEFEESYLFFFADAVRDSYVGRYRLESNTLAMESISMLTKLCFSVAGKYTNPLYSPENVVPVLSTLPPIAREISPWFGFYLRYCDVSSTLSVLKSPLIS